MIAVRTCLALRQFMLDKQLITMEMAKSAPYKVKTFRKLICYMAIGYSGNGMTFKTEARCLRNVPKWKFLMVLIRAGLAIAWIRILFTVSLAGNEVGRDCV